MAPLHPDQVVKHVGTRVGEVRRTMGLTQEMLADKLRISPGYVRKIELGRTNMTLHTLVRWANWLNVGLWDLIGPGSQEAPARPRRKLW